MYYSPLCLQVDMLQEENETIFDKVCDLLCSFPIVNELTSVIRTQVFFKMYSSDLRKRDARKQRPELGSLRSRCWLSTC